jgi:hypothetical protein
VKASSTSESSQKEALEAGEVVEDLDISKSADENQPVAKPTSTLNKDPVIRRRVGE